MSVSVIIPSHNSAPTIKACIESIPFGSEILGEVIVVDDCSTDDTVRIVRETSERNDKLSLILHEHNRGPAAARNTGARSATGEYLFFVDSDTRMHADTLDRFLEAIGEAGADAVSGVYSPTPIRKTPASVYKALFTFHMYAKAGVFDHNVFHGGAAGIRKDLYLSLGGYDELLTWGNDYENEEFGTRIAAIGKLLSDPRVMVDHDYPEIGKMTSTYFHRVSLWMKLCLSGRGFERGGTATASSGLGAAAGAMLLPTLASSIAWPGALLAVLLLLLIYANAYGSFYVYVARKHPAFLPTAFALQIWSCFILLSGAARGTMLFAFDRISPFDFSRLVNR